MCETAHAMEDARLYGATARWVCSHDVLRDEPHLQFVCPDHVAHQQIVRALVVTRRGVACHCACFIEDDLVRVQQARHLYRHCLSTLWRTGDQGRLGDVVCHRDAHSPEELDALRDGVHQRVLPVSYTHL